MPTKHHDSGPSSLPKQELCPTFTSDDPVGVGGTHNAKGDSGADEGTALHMIMETGVVPEDFYFDDAAKMLIENTTRLKEEIIAGADEVLNEVTYDIGDMGDGRFLTFGTSDATALYRKDLLVKGLDYKFGFLPVPPPSINPQCSAYALGMFEQYPWAEKVEFHLLLPRQSQHHTTHTFTRDDVPQIRLRIKNIIDRRRLGERNVFMDCCQYCDLAPICKPLHEKLHPLMSYFAQTAEELEREEIVTFDPEKLQESDPAHVAKFLRALDFLNKVRNKARDWAKHHILNGGEIPGYFTTMRPPRFQRYFTKDRRVLQIAFEEFGVEPYDLFEAINKLPKRAVLGCVRDTAVKGKGAATVRAFEKRLDEEKLWFDNALSPEDMTVILKSRKVGAPDPTTPKLPKAKPVLWRLKDKTK